MLWIKENKGISLFELMIALSIIAILTVASVPLFTTFIQEHRISATAESLRYALQYARSEAVKQNANVYVSFTTGDTWCYGINSGSSCNCAIVNNCNLGTARYAAAQQISFSTSGLSGNSVYFEGTHGAANASGSVTLTLYGQSSLITVNISRLGNLQMCSTGISGYTAC